MSLFDEASLVVTPSGYKEGKLYSIKPTDGSGDLNVVRATTATRVNSEGLIEVTPYNFLKYSEQFDNGEWKILNSASVSANTTTAPNGTLTADTLTFSASAISCIYQTISSPQGSTTLSIYAKVASGTKQFRLRIDSPSGNISDNFTATTEWQRFEFNVSTLGQGVTFYIINADTATSGSLLIWGAQINSGDSAKEYFPTTDRLNVPRLDYTNGSCPSILVEPQGTNLLLRSEEFDNVAWGNIRCSVLPNQTNAPNNESVADYIKQQTASFEGGFVFQSFTGITIGQSYVFSVFAKKNGKNFIALRPNLAGSDSTWFDLNNGTIGVTGASHTPKIEAFNDGWYRCSVKFNAVNSSGTNNIYIYDNNGQFSVADSGGVFVYGAQLEQGSNATSYIPTVASAVTRNADVISKTGIADLIGQTEGTIFFEYFNKNGLGTIPFKLTGSDGKLVWIRGTGAMFFGNGTSLIFDSYSTPIANQLYKIAFVYGQNDFRLYVNGSLVSSLTSGTFTGTFSDIQIPALPNEDPFGQQVFVNNLNLWTTKLTNAELETLTTL